MVEYMLLLQYVPYAVIRLLSSNQKSNRFLAIIIYLKECALIRISMSIIEKVFKYEETDLPIIKYKDEIWLKAVADATILRYKNTMKSIRDRVDPEDKRKLSELGPKSKQNEIDPLKSKHNEMFWLKKVSGSKGPKTDPLKRNEGNTIYIKQSARAFKRWVTKDVLPFIRKTGRYIYDETHQKYSDCLTFKIESETDFHVKVVSFLKKR